MSSLAPSTEGFLKIVLVCTIGFSQITIRTFEQTVYGLQYFKIEILSAHRGPRRSTAKGLVQGPLGNLLRPDGKRRLSFSRPFRESMFA